VVTPYAHWPRHGSERACGEGDCRRCELEQARDEARCQHVSPSPWGLAQCALPLDHEERHAHSPSEAIPTPTPKETP